MNGKKEVIALYAKQLRIPSFSRYQEILRQSEQVGYEDFLIAMMKQELESRRINQEKRRIKAAGFPHQKTLDELDLKRLLHVEDAFIHELACCDFIRNRQNIVMIGNSGGGNYRKNLVMERN